VFWLLTFLVKTVFKLKIVILSVAAGIAIAFGLQAREQSRSWGLLPGDADRALPGDDLVAKPDHIETRSLIIEARPAEVWPWLVQMGYGRGGWYSYAQLDRPWSPPGRSAGRSADTVLEELQDLAVGDMVPTHPGGGFEARVVETDAALVLYLDDTMVREQAQALVDEGTVTAAESVVDRDMPTFRLSWAFVLQEESGGRSRLIERFRLHVDLSAPQRRGLPVLGLGVFALMRTQMLGIKRRVERQGQASS
jgi:hypothetical protein